MKNPRIAIVHELLTMRGGAERVLKILADMFPEAPIYTLLYNEKKLGDWFPRERVRTSSIQPTRYPLPATSSFNHHKYLTQFPAAVEAWDFSEFDLVISTSSAFTHGIITNGKPKHLCYVHSPARYLWDRTHDVIDNASHGLLGWFKRKYLERTFHKLRIWDAEAAYRPDALLAASDIVKRRIQLYWRRESDVLYPPIDDFWLKESLVMSQGSRDSKLKTQDYFLVVSTLTPYKRINIAIEACNKLGKHLKIVGEGSDMKRLKKIAGPTIEFYGYRKNDELRDLYSNATATLFPGDEDFGLVPLESMACGTPVIAYKSGGALETIIEHKTGEFFDAPTADSLAKIIQSFDRKRYVREECVAQAKKFSWTAFEKGIQAAVQKLIVG